MFNLPGNLTVRSTPIGVTANNCSTLIRHEILEGNTQPISNIVWSDYVNFGFYSPPQLATAYGMPVSDGAGVKIGIIAPQGGGFLQSDLNSSYAQLIKDGKIPAGTVTPTIKSVLIDGVTGQWANDPLGVNGENTLDIYCVATLVPKANIVMYFGNVGSDIFNAVKWDRTIRKAVDDGCDILTMSYALPAEPIYGIPDLESTMAYVESKGVAFCVSSGDYGAIEQWVASIPDGFPDTPVVQYPGSSANVIAVGGTSIFLNSNDTRLTESDDNRDYNFGVTWGGGGGVSEMYPAPDFQYGLQYTPVTSANLFLTGGTVGMNTASSSIIGTPQSLTYRGVPDVSLSMSGYVMYENGGLVGVGGTSASCPVLAAFLARFQALTGIRRSSTQWNKIFYSNPNAFYDILVGTNNDAVSYAGYSVGYAGTKEWDAVTGLGPLIGDQIYNILTRKARYPKINYGYRPTVGRVWPRGPRPLKKVLT